MAYNKSRRAQMALRLLHVPAAATLLLASGLHATGAKADPSPVYTNQVYVERVRSPIKVDVTKGIEVLRFVLDNLPDQVKVYTGENYFYFKFFSEGVHYAGNIRLDVLDRDTGHVHFAYFREYNEWMGNPTVHYTRFEPKDGVTVTKVGPLEYTVSAGGKTVTFSLNGFEGIEPPKGSIRFDEDYIGPVADESGIRFFLVYNRTFKTFQYFLDETSPIADKLFASDLSKDILIGTRTGFAFLIDKYRKRKILIGVHSSNANLNNFLDGPFDQLPDNVLGDGRLRKAILDASPKLEGTIDIYGNSEDGSERYFVGSYLHYTEQTELRPFLDCASEENLSETLYYGCFSIEEESGETGEGDGSGGDTGGETGASGDGKAADDAKK